VVFVASQVARAMARRPSEAYFTSKHPTDLGGRVDRPRVSAPEGRRDFAPTPDFTACVLSTLPRGAVRGGGGREGSPFRSAMRPPEVLLEFNHGASLCPRVHAHDAWRAGARRRNGRHGDNVCGRRADEGMCDGVHGLGCGPSSGPEPQATSSRKRARCALDRRPPRPCCGRRCGAAGWADGSSVDSTSSLATSSTSTALSCGSPSRWTVRCTMPNASMTARARTIGRRLAYALCVMRLRNDDVLEHLDAVSSGASAGGWRHHSLLHALPRPAEPRGGGYSGRTP
jgi:hypothetical protein